MTTETYNGWTNYATWRIQLEIVSDWVAYEIEDGNEDIGNMSTSALADHIKDYVESVIEDSPQGLTQDYALAFINQVNWYELAQHAQEDLSEVAK